MFLFLPCSGPEYDDDLHDEISVQQILRDMLDKKVVEEDILNDLGFDGSKKKKDPRPKMELRHKQVSFQIIVNNTIIMLTMTHNEGIHDNDYRTYSAKS